MSGKPHVLKMKRRARRFYEVLDADIQLVTALVRECGFAHRRTAAVLWEQKDGVTRNPKRLRGRELSYYFAVVRKVYKDLGYNIMDYRNAETDVSKERLDQCLMRHGSRRSVRRRRVAAS